MRGIYEWVETIAFYSVLQMLVRHLLPAGEQKKYVRFFMGLVFLIILFRPVLALSGQKDALDRLFLEMDLEGEMDGFYRKQEQLETELEAYVQDLMEQTGREAVEKQEEEKGNGEEARKPLVEPVQIRIGAEKGIFP